MGARRTPPKASDERPKVAVGHISLRVRDIAKAADFFAAVGMRRLHVTDRIGILELRGGTHLVLQAAARLARRPRRAPFDLMVDDVDAAHGSFVGRGFEVSAVTRGSIHDSFVLAGPDGYRIAINSSHASGRPV